MTYNVLSLSIFYFLKAAMLDCKTIPPGLLYLLKSGKLAGDFFNLHGGWSPTAHL